MIPTTRPKLSLARMFVEERAARGWRWLEENDAK